MTRGVSLKGGGEEETRDLLFRERAIRKTCEIRVERNGRKGPQKHCLTFGKGHDRIPRNGSVADACAKRGRGSFSLRGPPHTTSSAERGVGVTATPYGSPTKYLFYGIIAFMLFHLTLISAPEEHRMNFWRLATNDQKNWWWWWEDRIIALSQDAGSQ